MKPIIAVCNLHKSFGGLVAVSDVSFEVEEGSIVGLIGPNGAGKTTVFNLITANIRPDSGQIHFFGQEISKLSAYAVVQLGIARTFQSIRLFNEMSVLENVLCGRHCRMRSGFFASLLHTPAQQKEERLAIERAMRELAFVGLDIYYDRPAKNLSYGQQRLLEIARALASDPRFIILDEPAGGMNEQETINLIGLLQAIQGRGVTVLLIEHDMHLVMQACGQLIVLEYGAVIACGPPALIAKDPHVIQAYLGSEGLN